MKRRIRRTGYTPMARGFVSFSQPFALSEVEALVADGPFDFARGERDEDAPCASTRGFTLIEVMVALVVFSLAAMALMRLEGATIRGAITLDTTIAAQMVARTVAVEAVTEAQAPALGRTEGRQANGGRDWAWTRVVSGTGDPRIVRIDVAVADRTGQVVGRATMVRPASVAAQ